MKKTDKEREQELLKLLDEAEALPLGKSTPVSPEEEARIDRILELNMIPIRLPTTVTDQLKALAEAQGLRYQSYIRRVLVEHAKCTSVKKDDKVQCNSTDPDTSTDGNFKTFKDLVFAPHHSGLGRQARLNFENGYGVSVLTGSHFYTDAENPYELGILKNEKLCYDTHLTDDVLGWLTADAVTETMIEVQKLKK